MTNIARLSQIAANNRQPITAYGMAGADQLFNTLGSLATRKRLAAGEFKNMLLGRQYLPPERRHLATIRHLNRIKELLHG
jgi:hypothetical protein